MFFSRFDRWYIHCSTMRYKFRFITLIFIFNFRVIALKYQGYVGELLSRLVRKERNGYARNSREPDTAWHWREAAEDT
ncbi:hypothetical protein KDAU_52090 [Dictyobacter aurantiacus]|uniref:Uncharacterized protein n=1 Tax=Dictyobacter aurantiacus TaxID=1936993 RepID=A0A401ZM22_9CHLR|nr:hypothetical protein KDAU_52090 [Dictyobacter aurantiacus]